MWFKNLQAFKLSKSIIKSDLIVAMSAQIFRPIGSMEVQSIGFVAPREHGELVHSVGNQMLIALRTEKKLLPSSVINQAAKERAAEIEDQQGFKPGRKQMREIKELIIDELLPKAFSVCRDTMAWIDPVNGWLVIDSATPSKADDMLKMLLKSDGDFQIDGLRVNMSPVSAMTDWLVSDEAPDGFTIDQDTELKSTSGSKSAVRYVRHTLENDDMQRHIVAGKQCTRLAMTWNDRVSFVLTENLTIKRIAPMDVIKESVDPTAQNDSERFDSDFALMTGELNKMLSDLVAALGGEVAQ